MQHRLLTSPLFIFVLSLGFTSWVSALYNGNPSFPMMPEQGIFLSKETWITLKTGYEWETLFNRKLVIGGHPPHLKHRVDKYRGMGNFGVMTLGCNDRVELYGVLGSVEGNIHYHPHPELRLQFETDGHFAWEVGGRAMLAYWGDIQFGVDAKYFRFNPQIDHLKLNDRSISPQDASYDYQEWQVGLGVSYRTKLIIPYFGLKYSDVTVKLSDLEAIRWIFPRGNLKMENRFPVGVFLGCGLCPERAFNVNAEVRLWDETAVTLSADLRY